MVVVASHFSIVSRPTYTDSAPSLLGGSPDAPAKGPSLRKGLSATAAFVSIVSLDKALFRQHISDIIVIGPCL